MDDLPWALEQMNTLAVLRHLGGEVRPAETVADSLARDAAAFVSGEYQHWVVWHQQEQCRLGRCGLFQISAPPAPPEMAGQRQIGWSFAERHWGNGYATEAARAALAYAFGPLGLGHIWSQTSDSNAASTRMMHRLGFSRRAELDYVDPDYPGRDNPTTVWRLERNDG